MLTRAHSSGDKCGPLPGAPAFVFFWTWWRDGYPLGMTNIAIENHHVQWEIPLEMVIFNSYVSLPEGTFLEDDPSCWELLQLRGRCHVAPGFGSLWQCSLGVQQLGWMAKWLSGSRSSICPFACISFELIKFVIESSKAARSLTAHWGGLALVFGTMQEDGAVVL